MTREEIIKLMDWHASIARDGRDGLLARVERAIRAAEAAEREACAQLCEGLGQHEIAAAIRARSNA
jgi:hypothetical protein